MTARKMKAKSPFSNELIDALLGDYKTTVCSVPDKTGESADVTDARRIAGIDANH